jgi:hypothetical protein
LRYLARQLVMPTADNQLLFHILTMRKPLLVLRTFMSLSLACMLTLPAIAQQELPYFREVLQRQQLARQLAPGQKTKLATIKATTTLTAAGACDVGTNGDFESQITPPTYLNNIGGGALASGNECPRPVSQLVFSHRRQPGLLGRKCRPPFRKWADQRAPRRGYAAESGPVWAIYPALT